MALFSGLDTDGNTGLFKFDGTTAERADRHNRYTRRRRFGPRSKVPDSLRERSAVQRNRLDGRTGTVGDERHGGRHTRDLRGTGRSRPVGLDPSNFEVFNGQVLFSGRDASGNQQLWETDGKVGGTTQQVTGINNVSASGLAPFDLTTATVNPPATGSLLWQNNTSGQGSIWELSGSVLVGGGPVSPNPGPSWHAVGTADFFGDGSSDILWQNTSTGQASIWEMNGTHLNRRGTRQRQSRAELECDRNGRFQRRRPFRHPVAEHEHRPGLDLGNEREQHHRRRPREPQSRAELEGDRNRRFQRRRRIPTSCFRTRIPAQVSIWEMDGNSLIGGGPVRQSRAELARDRNRRGRFRHPFSKHERPSRDLGHEREQHSRRRAREPQSRAELASGRADLTHELPRAVCVFRRRRRAAAIAVFGPMNPAPWHQIERSSPSEPDHGPRYARGAAAMHAKHEKGLAARAFHYIAVRAAGFHVRGNSGLRCQIERVICSVQVFRSVSFD